MHLLFKDTPIHYSTAGSGDAVILLHGFLESRDIWEPFITEFSEYGQVVTIDLPGHGQSGCIAEVHSMELMAEAVNAVLDKLQLQKCDFIGHSMGGYVILAFLENYPAKVGDIMLLNSHPQEDSEEKKEVRTRSIEVVKKNKKAYISMAISNLLTPEDDKKFAPEVQELKEKAYKFPTAGITAALQGMRIRKDRTSLLRNYDGTKLIVAGKEDPLMDPGSIKDIAKDCNCTFFVVPGGHLSYLESEEEFRKLCISSKK
ncbi:MAG: alpha/beta hydrolase [Salinimicrobium sp.]